MPVSSADRRGFSLLEAVIAMAVVSLAAVAALAALGAELRSARMARETLTAAALAEYRLETVRLLPAEQLRLLPDSVEDGRFAPPFEDFGWTVEVRPVAGVESLYQADVAVTGPEGQSALSTRVYRPELPVAQ
jgi:prepilin-type N-terminal cleavage/methylation domain-containing protein